MKNNKIKIIAKNVLKYEIEAINNLKKSINESFIKLVKTIID